MKTQIVQQLILIHQRSNLLLNPNQSNQRFAHTIENIKPYFVKEKGVNSIEISVQTKSRHFFNTYLLKAKSSDEQFIVEPSYVKQSKKQEGR